MSAGNQKSNPPDAATTSGNDLSDSMMSWTIKYIKEGHFVRVTVGGIYNLKDHIQMLEDVTARDFWKPGMNLLIDAATLTFNRPVSKN